MRIAINCRLLIPNKLEGIGWFIYETTKRMVEQHPEDTFILLFDRKPPADLLNHKNVIKVHVPPKARHPILYRIWFDFMLPRKLKKYDADIFLSADGFNSYQLDIPSYLIIHDLAYLHYPKYIDSTHLAYYKKHSPGYIKKASGLGTVSEYSRQDLAEKFDLNPDHIDVIFNGCKESFKPLNKEQKNEVKREYKLQKPYFIYAGSIHPRKNVVNIIRAYNHFRTRGHQEHDLVLVGRKAWMFDLFEQEYNRSPFKKDIHLLGYADEKELAALMGAAEALVYPSLFEGFGVPVLEAMHAEIPIITSNKSSLPEVAGKAAILVDPRNPQDIGTAMFKLAKHPELGKELVKQGRKKRKEYDWEQSAYLLYRALKRTALEKG